MVQGISERFRGAAAGLNATEPELLPSRLARAARDVTGADGAGLSVMSRDFRVPLGSSDADAATIERLQFTAEQGPCWDAVRSDLPLSVNAEQIGARWPEFADELQRSTRYHSVVSVPLRLARGVGGALDLYFEDPDASSRFDLDDGSVIAAHIADRLNRADHSEQYPATQAGIGPAWARGATARGRLAVWIAVGIIIGEMDGLPADALAVMRAAAYSAGRSLDDVAADLVGGQLSVNQLMTS